MSRSDDLRLGALLLPEGTGLEHNRPPIQYYVALLGYPCDEGVARNGGRIGAKDGPMSVRKIIQKVGTLVNPEFSIDIRCIKLKDAGDVEMGSTLDETHINLRNKVRELFEDGYIPVIVGGGNDQSYPNALGLMDSEASGRIGVVNVDAHLDARPLIEGKGVHSGSPFRQLLNDEKFVSNKGRFCEFAVQGNQCSDVHAKYVTDKGGDLIWLSQLRKPAAHPLSEFQKVLASFSTMPTFVSFDIDSITSSDCPGVSCPAIIGLSAQEALDICMEAGKHRTTKLLDISEFNPTVEEPRTSRLVATMIYYFLMGLALRK